MRLSLRERYGEGPVPVETEDDNGEKDETVSGLDLERVGTSFRYQVGRLETEEGLA